MNAEDFAQMMIGRSPKNETQNKMQLLHENSDIYKALYSSNAVIEFSLDGTIHTANQAYLELLGYELSEIVGNHHSMFVDQQYAVSAEYKDFWRKLSKGESISSTFLLIAKNGVDKYIQATYNSILDESGSPYKVVEFALDITQERLNELEIESTLDAINRSEAVISFEMDGTIIDANENFLKAVGYTLPQIQGKHHSLFVDPVYANSIEYQLFWKKLNAGEYIAGTFKRLDSHGNDLWLEASYSPVFDHTGKPLRVVKFATNVTEYTIAAQERKAQIEAINHTQAVVHFTPDGTIIWANDMYLALMGYQLAEVEGKHHRMFVEEQLRSSAEYAKLWTDLQHGIVRQGDFVQINAKGEKVYLQAAYTPIADSAGMIYKVITFAQDVSEQMKMRRESQYSLNSSLETVLSAVSTVSEEGQNAAHASLTTFDMIHHVGASAEQLTVSIREITQSMFATQEAVNNVIAEARRADESTSRLGSRAEAMTKILDLIQDIAEQISLLSLNAAIESARAGDAGRGFAVVANEVKSLAHQVQQATEGIAAKILSIQDVASHVVAALTAISSSIASVNDEIIKTSSAIERQSAVSSDIAYRMSSATSSITLIDQRITSVLESVESAARAAISGKESCATILLSSEEQHTLAR